MTIPFLFLPFTIPCIQDFPEMTIPFLSLPFTIPCIQDYPEMTDNNNKVIPKAAAIIAVKNVSIQQTPCL